MIKKLFLICAWLIILPMSSMAQEDEDISILNTYTFGNGFRLSDKNGNTMKITGYAQPFAEYRTRMNETDDPDEMRFRMRRLRLRLEGNSASDKISYRFQTDLSGTGELLDGSTNFLLDAWVAYNIARRVRITFGQRAPYSDNRELFMNSNTLQLVERSRLTSAFATIREVGVFLDATLRLSNTWYIKPYAMLTNGDGPNVFAADRGGYKYAGRLDFLPFGLFNSLGQFNQVDIIRERTPKLVFGFHYSYNQGVSSRSGRESGSILYLDANNEELLPDYIKFGFDFMFKYKGFSMIGEFIKSNALVPTGITQRVRNDGSIANTFLVNGVQDVENYIKNRMQLGEAYNIQAGYLFKKGISIDGRYTFLNADEFSFLNNGTFYNRPHYYTLGVGKYFGRNYGFKIQGDVTYARNDGGINDRFGNPTSGNEWTSRVVITYSF